MSDQLPIEVREFESLLRKLISDPTGLTFHRLLHRPMACHSAAAIFL